jgi:hypothetical protein
MNCEICDRKLAPFDGDKLCNNCWEVEHRVESMSTSVVATILERAGFAFSKKRAVADAN